MAAFCKLSSGNANGTNDGRSSTLGAHLVPGRTITINNGGTLLFTTNNIFGNGTGARGSGANIIPITINAGGILATTHYDILGNVTLNGGTMQNATTDAGAYEGFQFLGSVTAGGTAPSSIVSSNSKANELYFNTVFNVADVTGNSSADLLVPSILMNLSGDFASAVGSLTKTGAGTMSIGGANIYTGNTTISAGTVLLSGKTVSTFDRHRQSCAKRPADFWLGDRHRRLDRRAIGVGYGHSGQLANLEH